MNNKTKDIILISGWMGLGLLCLILPRNILSKSGRTIFLEKGLEGYNEYKQKVKYKVIPFIW